MKRSFLIVALLASATAASASVTYNFQYHSNAFGTTDWQFTVADFLSAAGDNYITSFDSSSSNFQSTILDVDISDPFSASPVVRTDGMGGSVNLPGWVGPFNQDGIYTGFDSTLTITGGSTAPEPAPFALIGMGGVLLALVGRRRLTSQKQIAS